MSDPVLSDRSDALAAHEVAAWLRRHPEFLRQFPDLADSLVVPREQGPAASLASYQLDVLRDKNRDLNRRLHALADNAEANEQLAVRTHQLTLGLMRQRSRAGTLQAMAAALVEDFAGETVRMIMFDAAPELADAPWLMQLPATDPRLAPFRDCLADGEPLCGRLQADKTALLYGDSAEAIQSSALLPVPETGLVAIGSRDANRFYPGMGTLFLRMMADALRTALQRFEGTDPRQ